MALVVTSAVLGGVTVLASPASAATEVIPLTCDNGQTYNVAVNGNGDFTPARIIGSTGVLIPVSFGVFTLTATAPDGPLTLDESLPHAARSARLTMQKRTCAVFIGSPAGR